MPTSSRLCTAISHQVAVLMVLLSRTVFELMIGILVILLDKIVSALGPRLILRPLGSSPTDRRRAAVIDFLNADDATLGPSLSSGCKEQMRRGRGRWRRLPFHDRDAKNKKYRYGFF